MSDKQRRYVIFNDDNDDSYLVLHAPSEEKAVELFLRDVDGLPRWVKICAVDEMTTFFVNVDVKLSKKDKT